MRYDLAVIGSGAAGVAAAIRARATGRSVVMIERGIVGGTCVNTGCVPSKALLAAAEARQAALDARFPGVRTGAADVDLPGLIGGKRDLVESLRAGKYTDLAAGYGWDVLAGTARFTTTDDVVEPAVRLGQRAELVAAAPAGHGRAAAGRGADGDRHPGRSLRAAQGHRGRSAGVLRLDRRRARGRQSRRVHGDLLRHAAAGTGGVRPLLAVGHP